jgi:hypothetical protein
MKKLIHWLQKRTKEVYKSESNINGFHFAERNIN